MRNLHIGTILNDDNGKKWVITDRRPYTIQVDGVVHHDYGTVLHRISRLGKILKSERFTTTDEELTSFTEIGKATFRLEGIEYNA